MPWGFLGIAKNSQLHFVSVFSYYLAEINKLVAYIQVIHFNLVVTCVIQFQNNLDELFMLMHFLDAGKVSVP